MHPIAHSRAVTRDLRRLRKETRACDHAVTELLQRRSLREWSEWDERHRTRRDWELPRVCYLLFGEGAEQNTRGRVWSPEQMRLAFRKASRAGTRRYNISSRR